MLVFSICVKTDSRTYHQKHRCTEVLCEFIIQTHFSPNRLKQILTQKTGTQPQPFCVQWLCTMHEPSTCRGSHGDTMRVNQHSRKHRFGDVSKRALASIKFYWVFSWFYNGSALPLGLVGFCLFCLQSRKLNPNLRFHSHYAIIRFFISQNLLLFCPRSHFQFLNIFVCFLSTDLLWVTWKMLVLCRIYFLKKYIHMSKTAQAYPSWISCTPQF